MVLPTGTISLSQVNAELSISPTSSTLNMDNTRVRCLASQPPARFPSAQFLTPGTEIAMSDLWGKPSTNVTGGNDIVARNGFRVHTFTGPGTLTITGQPLLVNYLVVAGGGTGGTTQNTGPTINVGGGGGAGGVRTGTVTAPATNHTITVGSAGGNSSFGSLIASARGGAGGFLGPGSPGGSGGGGSGNNGSTTSGGTGNQPAVSPPQGNPGGSGTGGNAGVWRSGGGGGAGGAGANGLPSAGGPGLTVNVAGVPGVYGRGGPGLGPTTASPGTGNGGGAGPSFGGSGSAGSPGIVIIWYPLC